MNPTTYVFHMRDGVKWQDGEPVTAEDVVFSYETIRSPKKPTRVAALLKDADTIELMDPSTVRITTKTPSAEFLSFIASASGQMKILPKHVIDRGGKWEDTPIGTGPFKIESFERLSKMILVRNDGYWREGPYVDKVVVIYGLDVAARLAAFVTRSTDIINIADAAQFESVRAALPEVQSRTVLGNYGYGIYFNYNKEPFSDLRVRRAMHLGIDRRAMFDTLTFGQGVINPPGMAGAKKGWVLTPEELSQMPGWRQPKEAEIAEAKRLLAEAGYPNGFKTTIAINRGLASTPQISEMLAGQMKAIGIDMTVLGQEPAVWTKNQVDGTYDTLLLGAGSMLPDSNLYNYFHSKGGLNTGGLKDPTVDRLIEAESQELDVSKRKELLRELQRRLADQAYHPPTVDLGFTAAWQPYVKHYVYNTGAQHYLVEPQSVWLDLKNVPPGR